jgi:hypothetical protein
MGVSQGNGFCYIVTGVFLQLTTIYAMPLTNNIITSSSFPSWLIITSHHFRSLNTSMIDGVPLMSKPEKNYAKHTTQNGTAMNTLPHLANVSTMNNDQKALVRLDVTIPDGDKLQFYLEEIYNSNKFEKQDMLTWEQSSVIIKTNFDQTKAYFEKIVKAINAYKQNTGGNSAQCNKYKSANQMANYGNELQE